MSQTKKEIQRYIGDFNGWQSDQGAQQALQRIVEQLAGCNYECEAGYLKNNVAFLALTQMANNPRVYPVVAEPLKSKDEVARIAADIMNIRWNGNYYSHPKTNSYTNCLYVIEEIKKWVPPAVNESGETVAPCEVFRMASMVIPKMVHPLGKHWEQPDPTNFAISDQTATIGESDFNLLKEYSASYPSGVYEGKMWKALGAGDVWFLLWYDKHEKPETCSIKSRKISITYGI